MKWNLKLTLPSLPHTVKIVTHTATLKSNLKTPWCFIFKNKYVIFPSLREIIQWPQIRVGFSVFPDGKFISKGYFSCDNSSHISWVFWKVFICRAWQERRILVKLLDSQMCKEEMLRIVLCVMTISLSWLKTQHLNFLMRVSILHKHL